MKLTKVVDYHVSEAKAAAFPVKFKGKERELHGKCI